MTDLTLSRPLGRRYEEEPHLTGRVEVHGVVFLVGYRTDTHLMTFRPADDIWDRRWDPRNGMVQCHVDEADNLVFGEWRFGSTVFDILATVDHAEPLPGTDPSQWRGGFLLVRLESRKYRH